MQLCMHKPCNALPRHHHSGSRIARAGGQGSAEMGRTCGPRAFTVRCYRAGITTVQFFCRPEWNLSEIRGIKARACSALFL